MFILLVENFKIILIRFNDLLQEKIFFSQIFDIQNANFYFLILIFK